MVISSHGKALIGIDEKLLYSRQDKRATQQMWQSVCSNSLAKPSQQSTSQIVSSTQEKFSEFFNQRGHFNLSLNSLISANLIYQIKFPITIANLCGHLFISGQISLTFNKQLN